MNQSKPQPLYAVRERRKCPVCGESVYSRSGIHPQCAQDQADAKRVAKLKARAKQATKTKDEDSSSEMLKAWHKRCPRCRRQVHVRKTGCDCGYEFPGSRPPAK